MKFTIRKRLTISSSLLVLVILVITTVSLVTLKSANSTLEYSVGEKFPSYGGVRDAAVDLHQILIAERELLYYPKDSKEYKESLNTYNKNITQSRERIDSINLNNLSPKEARLIKEYQRHRAIWIKDSANVLQLIKEDRREEAIKLSLGEAYRNYVAMEDALDLLGDGIKNEMEIIKDSHLQSIIQRENILLIVAISGLLVSILSSIFLSKSILDKLRAIGTRIHEISQGEGDLTAEIELNGNDELTDLAKGFNLFIEKLHNIIVKSKEESNKLIEIKTALGNLTEETAAAIYEIDANISSIKDMVKDLTSKVESADSSLNSMLNSKRSLDNDIEKEGESIQTSLTSISQILHSIKGVEDITRIKEEKAVKLVETSSLGGEKLTSTTEHVESINGTIESISELVALINSVSDSTNLLAMNAAIEAAHAGDAGKGFSVVADEIRKLAESSSLSAKGIKDVIEGVLESIKYAHSSGKEADDAFREIKNEVSEVVMAFRDIKDSSSILANKGAIVKDEIDNLSTLSASVQNSTDDMESYTKSVINNINDLNRLSTEVEGSIFEISNGTNEITLAIGEVKNLTDEMSQSSESLHREIGSFKTKC